MVRSNYIYNIIDDYVEIIDLNQDGMSVTNDAENVLTEINKEINIENKKIIYRDSDENWGPLFPEWKNGICIKVEFF